MSIWRYLQENFGGATVGLIRGHKGMIIVSISIIAMALGIMFLPVMVLAKDQKNATLSVVIEYGSKIKDVDFVAKYTEKKGIPVELRAGYSKPLCGRVTVNGTSIEFDQHSVDAGKLASYISRSTQGKKIRARSMPSCNLKP